MEPIAVIGIANLFPGSKNPEEFWDNLLQKKDTRSRLTAQEAGVDISSYMGKQGDVDKFYCDYGGFIRDFKFDPKDVHLEPERIEKLDDLYKWSLYTAREALKDAGVLHDYDILKRCGVVLANLSFPTRSSNYLFMPMYKKVFENALHKLALPEHLKLPSFSNVKLGVADDNMLIAGYPAALISEAFKLGGVNFALDAACASSCYSMKFACDYLNTGKQDLMLAGAVSAADPLFLNMGFSIFHAYPDNEKSAPLDVESKGLFAGEGAGFFVLKRYADAVRDGDNIKSIIRGVGLSNDGKGEFVLSPNSKGQVLAYERAYSDAQVNPSSIQMVECHATGTPKGDRVELASMGKFFSRFNSKPLIGSVKSNLSHLLSAAGMPGMLKVIHGLREGKVPATINLNQAVQAKDGYFTQQQIPTQTLEWPKAEENNPRRAGVSTFGFGGSNAHIVFEEVPQQGITLTTNPQQYLQDQSSLQLAILSMAAHFGQSSNLKDFQNLILNAQHNFVELPELRWKGINNETQLLEEQGLMAGKAPMGAYIDSFDVDFLHFKIPPRKTDALIPQQMLLLQVADEAAYQAQLQEGDNVAVIVAMGIELEMHRHRGRVNLEIQIKQALEQYGIELSAEEQEELISLSKGAMYDEASINQYTSFIGNLMAARVSAVWDFSGPAFTVSAEESSVIQCLDVAENLFRTTDVEAVVVAAVDLAGSAEHVILRNRLAKVSANPNTEPGWFVGEGAGAMVIKPMDRVADPAKVIATIDAYQMQTGLSQASLVQSMQQTLKAANCTVNDVGYIEAHASGIAQQDQIEAEAIKQVYPEVDYVGCVKNNIGHCFSASSLASIIKVACCMSEQRIPANPQMKNTLTQSYIFDAQEWPAKKRAVINSLGADGRVGHIVMSPVGKITLLERPKPKRQLILPVYLGDETIQDKILNPQAIEKFRPVKERLDAQYKKSLEPHKNNKESDTMRQESAKSRQSLPGTFVDLRTFEELMTRQRVTNSQSQSQASLERIELQEDYTVPEKVIWDKDDLIEFAEGKIANVFGPEFSIIDNYSRRVRLPTSDYLLVSRVTELEAKPNEYKPSMMTTEYDIPLDAPYLMDGQIAWSVAVESGQCDLLLISYLGIDFKNKGERVYRLLDCTLNFLEEIAFGGQTLRYKIYIDSFATQGDTTLFFFHYDCYVKDKKVLEMRGGCAGFFTDAELAGGKGVVRSAKELAERRQVVKQSFEPFLRTAKNEFNRQDLIRLIHGDVAGCFGVGYEQQGLNPSLQFSSEKFLMIDHVYSVDPKGGIWGLGMVESYKILEPDHWYFPCHFKDDQVMAGSLMSDGCGQLVMFYMLYLGLQTQVKNARFQPLLGQQQKVRCRMQVQPQSNRLHYRMEVKEIGLKPYPYIKANVEIILNDKVVVDFENMSVVMKEQDPNHPYTRQLPAAITSAPSAENSASSVGSGQAKKASPRNNFGSNPNAPLMLIEDDLDAPKIHGVTQLKHFAAPVVEGQNREPGQFPIGPFHFFEFATGSMAKCFGVEYADLDDSVLPHTPCGDLQLVSRVLTIEGERSNFKKPAVSYSEYEAPADAWYFVKGSHPAVMPYSILMEVALQPTGFFSGWMGTLLAAKNKNLFYRNLDGDGELLLNVDLRAKTIANKCTMLNTTVLGNNIIQSFGFELSVDDKIFYRGSAVFGYFTADALAQQLGLDKGELVKPWHEEQQHALQTVVLSDTQASVFEQHADKPYYRLAGGQLNFIDSVGYSNKGGKYQQGYIFAQREINAQDWFFQFHFHLDPVMPGSLGVEAIIEAMQTYMLVNNLGSHFNNPRFIQPLSKIVWKYRGQIIPSNDKMTLDVHIKELQQKAHSVTLIADANLYKDGMRIYEVLDIAVSLEESAD